MKIYPVPSSSLFKTLGSGSQFYSAELPYALMSSYADPSQVATGGPWNSDYFGGIPFHAGVYWAGNVVSTWGQPPSTNPAVEADTRSATDGGRHWTCARPLSMTDARLAAMSSPVADRIHLRAASASSHRPAAVPSSSMRW